MNPRNNINLIGNIGNDCEIRHKTENNNLVAFSLAESKSKKDSEGNWENITVWHDCTTWASDKQIELLKKGNQVAVSGQLTYNEYLHKEHGIKMKKAVIECNFTPLGINKKSE